MKTKKDSLIYKIFYFLIIFPLMSENIISLVLGDTVSKILCLTSCVIIFIDVIKNKKIKINTFFVVMLAIILQKIVTTFVIAPSKGIIVNNVNNIIVPYGMLAYFMLLLLIENNFDNKEKLKLIFGAITNILTICVLLNFFITGDLKIANNWQTFQEAKSTGYTMSRLWLFGHRNMIYINHLMWILSSFIYYKLDNKDYKKKFIFQFLFTLLVSLVSWNSTMMIVTIIIFAVYLLNKSFLKFLNIKHYIYIYLFLEFGIVFFRIQEKFSYLIVNILHRNITFTGRTEIWDYYINQFINGGTLNMLFGNFGYNTIGINSHNMFLGILAFSGIVGLILYMVLLIMAAVKLLKYKSTDNAKFTSIIIFGFLINALTMEFYLQPLFAVYIGYSIKKINTLCESEVES